MIKIPEMPNPFSLAFSSYRMTDFGKLFFGTIAAEAVYNQMNSSNSESVQESIQEPTEEEQAWSYYKMLYNYVVENNHLANWNSASKEEKQRRIIKVCLQNNRAYLVPAMQRYVFPTL